MITVIVTFKISDELDADILKEKFETFPATYKTINDTPWTQISTGYSPVDEDLDMGGFNISARSVFTDYGFSAAVGSTSTLKGILNVSGDIDVAGSLAGSLQPKYITIHLTAADGDHTLTASLTTIPATGVDLSSASHFAINTAGEITVSDSGIYRYGYSVDIEKSGSNAATTVEASLSVNTGGGFATSASTTKTWS